MVGKRNNILANAISTKTGNAGSRPGSTSPPVRLAAQPLALPRLPPLPHAQPVVSFVQLFVVQLSVTISVFALERVSPQLRSRVPDGLFVRHVNSVLPLTIADAMHPSRDSRLMSNASRSTDQS